MKRVVLVITLGMIAFIALPVLAGCTGCTQGAMKVKSVAFESHQPIPDAFSCRGQNINPGLSIENIPEGTKSLALIFEDITAKWVHWVVFNIPVSSTVEENTVPGRQGTNSEGMQAYLGPCPDRAKLHQYSFKLYALDQELNLEEGVTKETLEGAMETHILGEAELVGSYQWE
jgi:Raf kinase inhibitor-like YbhB/YbcL family protein